ncbi:metabotropic glycine receptor-like isoform X2 [Ptychodera flava]|uniref:metabotropic glycine receptor-like isoform X2 n=1 Tax=Ptychodera flava TaxID=63121 RepID=UPI00396A2F96
MFFISSLTILKKIEMIFICALFMSTHCCLTADARTTTPAAATEDGISSLFSPSASGRATDTSSSLPSSSSEGLAYSSSTIPKYLSLTEDQGDKRAMERKPNGTHEDDDKVVMFLRYVEEVQENIEDCERGTGKRLPAGEYNTDRFREQAKLAVNFANFLTRVWRDPNLESVQHSQEFFYVAVRSLLESNNLIFAAGNCYDYNEFEDFVAFCPYAHRLPDGRTHAKDLSIEYPYLANGNVSEWFFMARKKAEELLTSYNKTVGLTTFRHNESDFGETEEDESVLVSYENGHWSLPYFDCGGGNIWMMTYTVPFLGYRNNTYHFKGTSGIDIDLGEVDINQCPQTDNRTDTGGGAQLMHKERQNIFAGTDKCPRDSTECVFIPGLGFRRGSYKCVCKKGTYFPDVTAENHFFNGTELEREYDKSLLGEHNTFHQVRCLPCGAGCEECTDGRSCILHLDWTMRTAVLIIQCAVISCTTTLIWFTIKYSGVKVVKAASPVLLRIILLGSLILYCPILISYSKPSNVTCALIPWFNEVGFAISYGALLLKTWRISVVFRVRSAARVRITDKDLITRLAFIVAVFIGYVTIWTIVDRPQVVNTHTLSGLKTTQCSLTWWDHAAAGGKILLLLWGIRLSFIVRKAPSEFNESKFITWAIYNETLLSMFLNIALIFLQDPSNPDLRYIILFVHSQLTTTVVLGLLFGSKMYLVFKYQGKAAKHDSCSSKRTLGIARTCDKCHKCYIGESHVDAVRKLQPREPTLDRYDVEPSLPVVIVHTHDLPIPAKPNLPAHDFKFGPIRDGGIYQGRRLYRELSARLRGGVPTALRPVRASQKQEHGQGEPTHGPDDSRHD